MKKLAKRKYSKEVRAFLDSFNDLACAACGSEYGIHGEHVKTIGSGGPVDNIRNVMPICLFHHQEKSTKGISHMARKYTGYRNWLIMNDWEKMKFTGKWVNVDFT